MPASKNKSSAWCFDSPAGLHDLPDLEPNVASPIAKRVLSAARKAIPLDTHRGPALDDPEKCPFEIHEYQQWLYARLRSSGLAKGLAGGPAFLPDASDELSWPWQYFARLCAPRNYEQLTRKVVNNLEWYLDQSKELRDPWKFASALVMPCTYFTIVLMVLFYYCSGLNGSTWVTLVGTGFLLFTTMFVLMLTYNRNSHKHSTNTAELYSYLVEEYNEAEETESALNAEDWDEVVARLNALTHSPD